MTVMEVTPFAGANRIRFGGSAAPPHSQPRSGLPCLVPPLYDPPGPALHRVGESSAARSARPVAVGRRHRVGSVVVVRHRDRLSRTRSTIAAKGPVSAWAVTEPAAAGCGWVGVIFST